MHTDRQRESQSDRGTETVDTEDQCDCILSEQERERKRETGSSASQIKDPYIEGFPRTREIKCIFIELYCSNVVIS